MITDRRTLIAAFALAAAGPISSVRAQTPGAMAPNATMPTMPLADVKTAPQYFMGVIGPAELSLATSQLAIDKATQKNAHEFAGFEFGEAITVNMILKDMGTKAPSMDSAATGLVEKMKTTPKGASFDQAYISFQLSNHEHLRDLADAYLHNTVGTSDPAEKHGRHLASLMLGVFKEHVAICKRISGELKA